MIRVTKVEGLIFFDIQNKLNDIHIQANKKMLKRKNSKFYKIIHIIKQLILFFTGKVKSISWKYIIYETPTNPNEIIKLIKEYKFEILARNDSDELVTVNIENLKNYHRLIFIIKK